MNLTVTNKTPGGKNRPHRGRNGQAQDQRKPLRERRQTQYKHSAHNGTTQNGTRQPPQPPPESKQRTNQQTMKNGEWGKTREENQERKESQSPLQLTFHSYNGDRKFRL
ncbi:hypothetical protein CHS0354_010845 [Potamilus streckersoni]|uniref:Uncharacterized protein n=1 Tax=Potamilus streckersoni TaxID=2493646 RepID=A0AAE0WA93_9BIVA|nr:hypothetical protein CHS0354_010845 [Potamilus streckersoni]